MRIPRFLKQWWWKFFRFFKGGETLKKYNEHTWKLWQVVRITVTPSADPRVVQLVAAAAGRFQR